MSDDALDRWRHFADPCFAFEFDYPARTAKGADVTLQRSRHEQDERVHVTSDDQQVYFELDRASRRSADDGISFLAADVLTRSRDAWLGNPVGTELCGVPALSVHFKFDGKVRWAIFTQERSPSYRVIVDPRSATSLAILGTLVRATR